MKRSTVITGIGFIMYLAGYVAVMICIENSANAGEVTGIWMAFVGCALMYFGGIVVGVAE